MVGVITIASNNLGHLVVPSQRVGEDGLFLMETTPVPATLNCELHSAQEPFRSGYEPFELLWTYPVSMTLQRDEFWYYWSGLKIFTNANYNVYMRISLSIFDPGDGSPISAFKERWFLQVRTSLEDDSPYTIDPIWSVKNKTPTLLPMGTFTDDGSLTSRYPYTPNPSEYAIISG